MQATYAVWRFAKTLFKFKMRSDYLIKNKQFENMLKIT